MAFQAMNQSTARVGAITFLVFAGLMLSACAGKKAATNTDSTNSAKQGTVADITRPPQMIKGEKEVVEESNPDETISYDEWRKRREAELKIQDEGE